MSKQIGSVADVKLNGWSATQVEKAAQSLLNFIGKQQLGSKDLLGDEDEMIYLQLSLKKMPLQSRKDKPVALPLPHPILSPEGAEVCLFVKDHKGEGHKEAKRRLEQFERKGGVTKVIGISKLKTKYESHEAKRELCKLYDLFLADERILPSLPKLIGKSFFNKKKQPIPVKLTVKDFPAQVKKACGATYLFKTSGTCVNLRVARSSLGVAAIAENVHATLVQAVEHIPKKWANVQGVFLKTADSVALPLFQTLPDAPQRIGIAPAAPAQALQELKPAKVAKTATPKATMAGAKAITAAPAKAIAPSTAKAAVGITTGGAKKAAAPVEAAEAKPSVKAVAGRTKVASGTGPAKAAGSKRAAPQQGKPATAAKRQSR